MSYKAQILYSTGLETPQTIERFLVKLPHILDSPIRVYSTVIPQKVRTEMVVNICGQPVTLPSKDKVANTWTCKAYETAGLDVHAQIELLKKDINTSAKGNVLGYQLQDIPIFITDRWTGLAPVYWTTLKGAWLKSVGEPTLDWSQPNTPLTWALTFCYSDIQTLPF